MNTIEMKYPLHTRRKSLLFAAIFFTVLYIFCNIYYKQVVSRRCFKALQTIQCDIKVSTHDLTLKLNEKENFTVELANYNTSTKITLNFDVQHKDIVKISPTSITLDYTNPSYEVTAEATSAGHSLVTANSTDNSTSNDIYLRVTVYKNHALDTVSLVIGWIYFAAWSVSFYPQIYINYRRKSVVGLNFDFIMLNVVGFALYSIFNIGLYTIPSIQEEYSHRYPRGLNPVQINDVVFAVHATLATCITIMQCFLYERGGQRVSITARGILGIFAAFLLISLILSATNVLLWLDFLYYCSYVKLGITLIKYMPQAYMNYKRKSTAGWSIGNILLDFTGGMLSMLQMILISYNYNDWVSIFGDPTKFGLGLFSVIFDIFFMVQHYVLYRNTNYEMN